MRSATRLASALAATGIVMTAAVMIPSAAQAATCTPAPPTVRWVTTSDVVQDTSLSGAPGPGSWVFEGFHEGTTVVPFTNDASSGPAGLSTVNGSLFLLIHTLAKPVSGTGLGTAVSNASFVGTNVDSLFLATSAGEFSTEYPQAGVAPTWTDLDGTSTTYTPAQLTTTLEQAHATITAWSVTLGDEKFAGLDSTLSRITIANETDSFTPKPTATANAATTTVSAATTKGVAVRGSGFAACERVTVRVDGQTMTTLTANASGSVAATVRPPASVVPRVGTYRLTLVGRSSTQTASTRLVITPNPHHHG